MDISRELVSAVLSHVTLLILYTQAESGTFRYSFH